MACVLLIMLVTSTQLPFSTSSRLYTTPLQLVEVDLYGPDPFSSNGMVYYKSFVDVRTHYTWIYYLLKNNYIVKYFIEFH